MERISNDISKGFSTCSGRKYLVENYCNSGNIYFGINEDGEDVELSINSDGMVLKTYQNNGFVRVNYYDSDGYNSGETFEGRWT